MALLAGIGIVYASHAVRQPGPLASDRAVLIAPGSDSEAIISQLQSEGVIDSPLLFAMTLFIEGAREKLKAGEYLFKQNATMQEVIDTIEYGRAILHAITIPEGLTTQQIVDRLRADDVLVGDIQEIPREGALLPETYKFQRGDSRDKLISKMARDQKLLLDEIWRRRSSDLPLASPYELVTLASIVEKETGKADERPRVAGVFINRLRRHMRLQSDPTIVYGLVGGQGALGRPLTHADVETPSPYNTYLVDGLPPGPIANPGRAALEAVPIPRAPRNSILSPTGAAAMFHRFARRPQPQCPASAPDQAGETQGSGSCRPHPTGPAVRPRARRRRVLRPQGELFFGAVAPALPRSRDDRAGFAAAAQCDAGAARSDRPRPVQPRLATDRHWRRHGGRRRRKLLRQFGH